jgi:hypothetical protein
MTFEQQARRQLEKQTDYQLQRFTDDLGIDDPALGESPLSHQKLQKMAEEELATREEECTAAALLEMQQEKDALDDL